MKYNDLNYLDTYGKLQEDFTIQLQQLVKEIDKQLSDDISDTELKPEIYRILDHMLWHRKDEDELQEFASQGYEWLVAIIRDFQDEAKEQPGTLSGAGTYLKLH